MISKFLFNSSKTISVWKGAGSINVKSDKFGRHEISFCDSVFEFSFFSASSIEFCYHLSCDDTKRVSAMNMFWKLLIFFRESRIVFL